MTIASQKNGPASVGALPDLGSTNPLKDQNMDTNSTAAADQQERDPIWEAREKLTRIKDLNELMFMAGEGLLTTGRKQANAITAGCDTIGSLLQEICDLIDGVEA